MRLIKIIQCTDNISKKQVQDGVQRINTAQVALQIRIQNVHNHSPIRWGLSTSRSCLGGIPTQGESPRRQTCCSEEDWLNLPSGGAPFIPRSNLTCGQFWLAGGLNFLTSRPKCICDQKCVCRGHTCHLKGAKARARKVRTLQSLMPLVSPQGGCTCHKLLRSFCSRVKR